MTRRQCLNTYHYAYGKRMKKLAIERSKQPPMSPAEFTVQAKRLRQANIRVSSAH